MVSRVRVRLIIMIRFDGRRLASPSPEIGPNETPLRLARSE